MAGVDDDSMPDIYVDAVQITTSVYGVAFGLGLNPPHQSGPRPANPKQLGTMRMSLEHAKVVAMILRQQLKTYERENGKIPLPPGLYTSMGIAEEDWGL